MPEPVGGISWGGYKVRVTNPTSSTATLCSDEFRLVSSDDALALGKFGRPFVEVVSPQRGDLALVGEEYTVQVSRPAQAVPRFTLCFKTSCVASKPIMLMRFLLKLSDATHFPSHQFLLDNGIRSPDDRFMIDLYMFGGGSGDCGVWVGSLCDEPDIGCKDSGKPTQNGLGQGYGRVG